jgi:hypothetical protein
MPLLLQYNPPLTMYSIDYGNIWFVWYDVTTACTSRLMHVTSQGIR